MFRKLASLFSGTLIAQIIGLLSYPIITRLFDAEAIGNLTLITSISMILGNVALFSLPLAVVTSKTDREAKEVIKIALSISMSFISILFFLSLILYNFEVLNDFLDKVDVEFISCIVLLSIILSLELTFTQWLLRKLEYKKIGRVRIVYSVVFNLFKVCSFYLSESIYTLVWVSVLCGLIKVFLYYYYSKSSGLSISKFGSRLRLKFILSKNKSLIKFRTTHTLINSFSQSLPVIFLSKFYSISEVGYFGLAKALLELPINLIGNTISSGLYPYFTRLNQEGDSVLPLVLRSLSLLVTISCTISLSLFLFGKDIFYFVFSSDWVKASDYALYLSISYISLLSSRVILPLINIFNLERILLISEVFSVVFRFLSLYIPLLIGASSLEVIKFYSIANFVIYLFLILVVLRKVIFLESNSECSNRYDKKEVR